MICVLDENGKVVREAISKGSLRQLLEMLKQIQRQFGGSFKVCYEASGGCGWLHDQLAAMGMKVQVAHPGKLRMIFRSKRKNDRVDAQKLAKLLYLDEVPLAFIPTAEIRQWRSLIEYRQRLVVRRAGIKCRLRALLHDQGLEVPRGLWMHKGLVWLAGVELPEPVALQRDLMLEDLTQGQQRIARVERTLRWWAERMPAVGLLMTIPGVGPRTAEAVAAYIVEASRFRRNKSVGCYFGMIPCEDTSVKSRFGHITKEGPPTVRRLVTEATWQAIRRDASMRAYFEKVCRGDANRKKIALIATAHHLLRAMHAMMSSGEVWRAA
jgi:transposase